MTQTVIIYIIGIVSLFWLLIGFYLTLKVSKENKKAEKKLRKNVEHINKASDYLAMYEATLNEEYLNEFNKEIGKVKCF